MPIVDYIPEISEAERAALDRKRAYVARLQARPKRQLPDLPEYYYLSHFDDMCAHVLAHYPACLNEDGGDFLRRYQALPDLARCLYARLASRKGLVFDPDSFAYAEITDLDTQISILRKAGFIRSPQASDGPNIAQFLTKPKLIDLMRAGLPGERVNAGLRKAELNTQASQRLDWGPLCQDQLAGLIVQNHNETLAFILFLYFGRPQANLQSFTLRDLGVQRAPDLGESYGAQFDDEPSARAAYFYARALADFKAQDDDTIEALISSVPQWPSPAEAQAETGRDKLLQKLGGYKERAGDINSALMLYGISEAPLCNEREIRLRWRRNEGEDRVWVKRRLEDLIDNPGSDDEAVFAQDFYARKCGSKRTSVMTDFLRGGLTLKLDEAFRNTPERAALAHYKARGTDGFRMENEPWRALFGLTFWEPLFGQGAQMHSAFDYTPRGLKLCTFYDENSQDIEQALTRLSQAPGKARLAMLKQFSQNYDTVNGVFSWRPNMMDRIEPILAHNPQGAAEILRLMAQDWRGTKDGFPDLMIMQDGTVKFLEVKAEGDAIRRNQMTRIMQMRRAGFEVDIARIIWTVDPDQSYVVVDIETTGGRAGNHRITEIGAVKIQGGEIVDEWQSLINPQRPIPPFITRLTGISDDMVASAPLFADIAQDFAEFMQDSVFVAHNVNFDYSFIAEEYRRLDMWFRFPKLCTVASMRRFYPGQKSYSLKNLCAAYDIDLSSHHRAMCDARAAAELLKMINQARMA